MTLQLKTNRSTDAYRRMTCAGFTIGEPYLRHEPPYESSPATILLMHSDQVCVDFTCVCGRRETLMMLIDKAALKHDPIYANGKWDAALSIERAGSVNVSHLRADGFSEEDIKRIRYVYDLEDELKELRHVAERYYIEKGEYSKADELRKVRRASLK